MRKNLKYVPIIKAKDGEFKGLEVTAENSLNSIMPLFEILDIPWNFEDECESKTIDSHLDKLTKKVKDCIGSREFFLDSRYLDEDRLMNDGTHHMKFLFNEFNDAELNGIPVTSFTKSIIYKNAVKEIYQENRKGICLRITSAELASRELSVKIDEFLSFYSVNAHEVDFIIDLKNITAEDRNLYFMSLSAIINNNIPYLTEWKEIIISATSFPENLSEIVANTIDSIERTEWLLYKDIIANQLARTPVFSDYSIANSEFTTMDPRFMQMSASIRYTADNYWLIIRGRSTKTQGFVQYHNLCLNLIGRLEYKGVQFSWGDKYIEDCANKIVGTGNATTWRKVGNNHHFEFVVEQLSNLP